MPALSPLERLGHPAVQISQPALEVAGLPPWTEQLLPLLRLPLGLEGQLLRAPLPQGLAGFGCESDSLDLSPPFPRPPSPKDATGLDSMTKNLVWIPYSTAGFRVPVGFATNWLCDFGQDPFPLHS